MICKRLLNLLKRRLLVRPLSRIAVVTANHLHLGHIRAKPTRIDAQKQMALGPISEETGHGDFDFVKKTASFHVLNIDDNEFNIDDLPLDVSIVIAN
jgi:hypothetical protein